MRIARRSGPKRVERGSGAGARAWAAALGQRGSGLSRRRGCGVEWATGCGPRREVAWAAAHEQAREKRGKEKEASWASGPREREKRRDGPAGFPWAGLWSF